MPAPNSTADAMIYVSEGAGTISLDDNTKSVVVAYDPEATFRNGQSRVVVYERDSTSAVIKESLVDIGRASTDFLAGAIISSALRVTNTSASDLIAGNQTQATLHSIPKVISSLTSTSLIQNVRDKDAKLISNINSKFEGTQSIVLSEHMGERMALLRDGAKANLARMGFNFSAGTAGGDGIRTSSNSVDLVAPTSDFGTSAISAADKATSLARAIYDSGATGNTKDPITFATFKVHLTFSFVVTTASAADVTFVARALDSTGVTLDSVEIAVSNPDGSGSSTDFQVSFDQSLVSTTSAISRVTLHVKDGTATLKEAVTHSGRLEAVEETGDIPGRGVHVAVIEGVNKNASLNFHGANVIAGIPDSATAFIAGSGTTDQPEYGLSEVQDGLQALKYSVQRAFTVSGANLAAQGIAEMGASSGFKRALGRGRSGLIRGFRKFKAVARATREQASDVARTLQPVLQQVGEALSTMEGGEEAGSGMLQLSQAIGNAQDAGVLQASYGRMGRMAKSFSGKYM
jgi:hypothetical protein